MKYVFLFLFMIVLNLQAKGDVSEFLLDSKEIKNIATLANIDLMDSKFMKDIESNFQNSPDSKADSKIDSIKDSKTDSKADSKIDSTKDSKTDSAKDSNKNTESKKNLNIIAISDFINASDFEIDIQLLASEILKPLLDSKKFALSAAISGNALQSDVLLDKIRQMRNNDEFKNLIPKNSLLAPRYSLSARISSTLRAINDKSVIEYNFIFAITDLLDGLVVWSFNESVKRVVDAPLPSPENLAKSFESKWGRACKAKTTLNNFSKAQTCEIAVSELWLDDFASLNKEPQNAKNLAIYAKNACELDSIFGCRALGLSYKFGVGVTQDLAKARSLYEKSCKKKDLPSCYNLALLYQNAQGVSQDLQRAKELHKSACDKGFAPSCENVKMLDSMGEDKLEEIAMEYERECAGGNGKACGRLATYYYHGMNGASKNDGKAFALFSRGCELADINSCYQVSLWYAIGMGGAVRDSSKALEFALKSCDDISRDNFCDSKLGCESEILVFKQSACNSVAEYYRYGGVNLQTDSKKAAHYYRKSCDLGLKVACNGYNSLQESLK